MRDPIDPKMDLVTESDILGAGALALMRRHGVDAVLVGEAFMRAPDLGLEVAPLFFDR